MKGGSTWITGVTTCPTQAITEPKTERTTTGILSRTGSRATRHRTPERGTGTGFTLIPGTGLISPALLPDRIPTPHSSILMFTATRNTKGPNPGVYARGTGHGLFFSVYTTAEH